MTLATTIPLSTWTPTSPVKIMLKFAGGRITSDMAILMGT